MLRHHFRLGSIVTTVDAVNGALHLAANPESVKQVAVADRLVVTKTDLAEPGVVRALAAELARLNPTAPILDARADALAADDADGERRLRSGAASPPRSRTGCAGKSSSRLRIRRITATTGHGTDVTSTPSA